MHTGFVALLESSNPFKAKAVMCKLVQNNAYHSLQILRFRLNLARHANCVGKLLLNLQHICATPCSEFILIASKMLYSPSDSQSAGIKPVETVWISDRSNASIPKFILVHVGFQTTSISSPSFGREIS